MQRAHQSGAPYELYQYDSLNQLTEVWTGADAATPDDITDYERHQNYNLDPLGNRLTLDADGAQTGYQPSNGQRLTNPMHRYEQVNGAALEYDDTGNLLSDGTNSYTYDVLNRQISLTTLDNSAEYVYDALGRRVAKVLDGVTTYYLYNAGYQVIEERDAADALQARYTYGSGIDEPLTIERGGSVYYYHRDGLGSVSEISDQSGNLVERYGYDVYGAPTIFDSTDTELTASAIGNPYLFTGRRYDPESGNYYYRARIYSPELGRFLQTDPLGYVDGLNLYAYVGNNPVSWIDPLGTSISIPWDGLVDLVLPELISTGTLLKGILNGIGGAVVGVLGDASYAGESAEEMRLLEELARQAAAMDEVDDGEDASSVTPTDDEGKVCEIDPGPGENPKKKDPKLPKKGRGGDEILEQIKDELERMRESANVTKEGIRQIEEHLGKLDALDDPANLEMLRRLKAGEIGETELRFYEHELIESQLIEDYGYEGARNAHLETLEKQGIEYKKGYEKQLYGQELYDLYMR